MFNWQKEVGRHIPGEISGYDFVRSYPVFIPYQEVRLTVLERQIVALPFVQDCVMSSISAGVHDIGDLSAQFGIEEEIMVQIVAQLDSLHLVSVSMGRAVLTGKGEKVLKEQQRVQVSREETGLLYVNLISGKITDKRPLYIFPKQPPRSSLYLDEEYPTDLDFFRSHFEQVAEIYDSNNTSSAIFGHSSILNTNLYRITDVAYKRLLYVRERCSVFINQQDRSLRFRFSSGEESYEKAASKQLQENKPGILRLLNTRRLPPPPNGTNAMPEFPSALIDAARAYSERREWAPAMESAYFQSRPLLDGEIIDMLENCADFRAKAIYLSLPICGEYLSDATISALTTNVERLILSYDKDDYSANSIIQRIKGALVERHSILELREDAVPSTICILLGNTCGISAVYVSQQTAYHRTIYRVDARVTFDHAEVKRLWEQTDNNACTLLYKGKTNDAVSEVKSPDKDRRTIEIPNDGIA